MGGALTLRHGAFALHAEEEQILPFYKRSNRAFALESVPKEPLKEFGGGRLLGDQVLGAVRDLGPGFGGQVQRLLEDASEDLPLVVAREGRGPAQQDVQDDARAPHVCRVAVAPLQPPAGQAGSSLRQPSKSFLCNLLRALCSCFNSLCVLALWR